MKFGVLCFSTILTIVSAGTIPNLDYFKVNPTFGKDFNSSAFGYDFTSPTSSFKSGFPAFETSQHVGFGNPASVRYGLSSSSNSGFPAYGSTPYADIDESSLGYGVYSSFPEALKASGINTDSSAHIFGGDSYSTGYFPRTGSFEHDFPLTGVSQYAVGSSALSSGIGYDQAAAFGKAFSDSGAQKHTINVFTKQVPVAVPHPVPVHVTKNVEVPYPVPVPVHKPVPYKVEVKVQYPVEKPFPIKVPHPVPVKVEVKVPVPVEKPYPVHITRTVTVPVTKIVTVKIPDPVQVPEPVPYPVAVPKSVQIEVPHPVIVKVPEVVNLRTYVSSAQLDSVSQYADNSSGQTEEGIPSGIPAELSEIFASSRSDSSTPEETPVTSSSSSKESEESSEDIELTHTAPENIYGSAPVDNKITEEDSNNKSEDSSDTNSEKK